MTLVAITVMPKQDVLDPQGQTVRGALEQLGFDGIGEVRVGKRIELDVPGDDAAGDAKKMCDALLVNDLIEDYTVEVLG